MAIAVTPRSVGMMLAATVVAGWFETVTTPDTASRATPQQSSRAQGGRVRGEVTAPYTVPDTSRLRDYLNAAPSPSRGRNPFVYGSRMPARTPAREVEVPEAEPVPLPVEPPTPIFKLSGIASNAEGGAVTLTAIIIDNGSMVFAKDGDKLSNGFSVVSVSEMSVTLVDATGVTQTIRLP
jgi:hypothetical protein